MELKDRKKISLKRKALKEIKAAIEEMKKGIFLF